MGAAPDNVDDLDCCVETFVLNHFMQAGVGGNNGKATQTSGLEASRVNLNLDVNASSICRNTP